MSETSKIGRYEIKFKDAEYDNRRVLVILRDGEELEEYTDGGQPEDNCFYRDWSWISKELFRAYSLGFEDGKAAK